MAEVDKIWGGGWKAGELQLGQVLRIETGTVQSPGNLFAGILAHVCASCQLPLVVWATGACMAFGAGDSKLLVELHESVTVDGKPSTATIVLTLRTHLGALLAGEAGKELERIDYGIRATLWMHGGAIVRRFIPCPLCRAQGVEPFLIDYRAATQAAGASLPAGLQFYSRAPPVAYLGPLLPQRVGSSRCFHEQTGKSPSHSWSRRTSQHSS